MERKNNNSKIKYLTNDELARFFSEIEKSKEKNKLWLRDLTMFNLGYFLGLRGSEIGELKVNSLKENGEIYVERKKGSNNNTLRLDSKRLKLVKKYLSEYRDIKYAYSINGDYDYLFKSKNGKKLGFNSIWRIFKKYCINSKIPKDKLHPHCLKHSIAISLAEQGVDIKELQFYLGHKSINSTMVYFSFTSSQLDNFYSKLIKKGAFV